ncbi:hypothetical protein [Pseudomonas sp. A-RE-19]|uniref:hypothetical protein n=1 Tax=Pseudomonas sp. A-RE-19 TaxID=2832401 RepID=UPI001CBFA806|nr:hypothetical protein [Pseudomonas sp. A-RE-19]
MDYAQSTKEAGTLDPTFGDNGMVLLPLPGISGYIPSAFHASPDKKLLIALRANVSEKVPAKVVRVNENGTIDTTFGIEGAANVPLEDDLWLVPSALYPAQSGGWIITGTAIRATEEGEDNPDLAVIKLKDDGQLDDAFGTRGRLIITIADLGLEAASGVKFKPRRDAEKASDDAMVAGTIGGADIRLQDDKIVLVSTVFFGFDNLRGLVLRLHSNGKFDTSFNKTGFVFIEVPDHPAATNYAHGVKVQPDLKVLVCGNVFRSEGEYPDAYLMRYNRDGTVDTTFGAAKNGVVIISDSKKWLELYSIALKPDGGVVAAGHSAMDKALIIALDANGSFNLAFNQGQPLFSGFLRNLSWFRSILQQDGKIITVGVSNSAQFPTNAATVTARFDAHGKLDETFAGQGWTLIDKELSHAIYRDSALMPDERLVVCGFFMGAASGYVARYLGGESVR